MLKIALTKRKYFEQEQEVRLLYTTDVRRTDSEPPKYYDFDIDIDALIDSIYLAPNTPAFQKKLLADLLGERACKIKDSEI